MRFLLAMALLAASPTLAFAHTGVGNTVGFMHGLEHPLGGLDHMLAMVAVGVFAYTLAGHARWLVPTAFVAMMVAGFALGTTAFDLPLVETGIALSSIVIGIAAASGRSMPTAVAMALVGAFAVFHGFAHGGEMPAVTDGTAYALGFVVATTLLHAVGLAAAFGGHMVTSRLGNRAARLAGGALALGGVGVLAGWL